MASQALNKLTPREREILTLIAEGDSLAEIAQKLSRSLKTIESHRLSIGRKLEANNRVELAKIAISNGLVKLEISADETLADSSVGIEQIWINKINETIQQATGRELIERFCIAASNLPGVDIAAICTSDRHETINKPDLYSRMLIAASDNGNLLEAGPYNAKQTPCEQLIEHGSIMRAKGIRDDFPNDTWLAQVKAEGYVGMMLNSHAIDSIGGIGFISRAPMENMDALRQVIAFYAPRLAGAIQVCIEIESLRSENDRLQAGLIEPHASNRNRLEKTSDQADELFLKITQRIEHLAGTAFLRELIDAICEEYGFFAGGICALDPSYTNQTLQTVSFCIQNTPGDPIRYQAKGTPCEIVLQQSSLCLVDNAARDFPADTFMQEYEIRGFCGNRLPGPDGKTAGVIWVVDQSPLIEPDAIQALLMYYAPRMGAELANFMKLEMLMQERERLEAQLVKKRTPRTAVNT